MRLVSSLTAGAAVVVAAAIGITAAQASPGSVQRGVTALPGAGAVTAPAQIAPNKSSTARTHTFAKSAGVAKQGSFNWSGYVGDDGGYTSVTSSWIQPTVSCTSKGIVSFWVGLDGWTNGTVEQDGTGADCRTGKAAYYAWWQTYPANSQQTYSVTVAAGDAITSTVSYANDQYTLVLTDRTQGWTKTTTAAAPDGSANASAEIVAEAASVNGTVSQLPNFRTVTFTGSAIDGTSLPDTDAAAVDMVNQTGSVIASTGQQDADGTFGIVFQGGVAGIQAAFQSDAGALHTYDSAGDDNQKQAVLAGTDPSIAALPGGAYETAYQGTTGHLTVSGVGGSGTVDTGLQMAPGTSPSITALPKGGYEVAFQADTGLLSTYTSTGASASLGYGMSGGTSPSITALATGGVEIAFQANTGELWAYVSTSGSAASLKLTMAGGTSPSITAMPKSGFMIAYQADTGFLWMYSSSGGPVNQGLGMAAGSSPSIAANSSGGFAVALQANTQTLWTYVSGVGSSDQKLAMAPGTDPAIVAVSGGYETAVQLSSGEFMVAGNAGVVHTGQQMLRGTSPDIAP